MAEYTVLLKDIIKEFFLKEIYKPENFDEVKISNSELNRAALQLVGYFEFFDPTRMQIMGMVEHTYIQPFPTEKRLEIFNSLFSKKIPVLIITRGLYPFPEMLESAKKYRIPILQTDESTSNFFASMIGYLNLQLAPRIVMHGVMVEVYGEGILLTGDSGIGKSETAMELLKRGHRLIADDAVEIKRVSSKTLVGTAPEVIRHFIELRGVGIIDVRRIFGMGSVKMTEKVDMLITLEPWEEGKEYERVGETSIYTNILGLDIPSHIVPIRPGRNLAIIIEVAAMNNRQKKMGFNAAQELFKGINMEFDDEEE